jgi:hypothetical protein
MRLTDDQRRQLAVKAKALGRKALLELTTSATSDTALCKNEVILFARLDLLRFALRNIWRSLVLFLIAATQKELAWQARHLGDKNQFLGSSFSRGVAPPVTDGRGSRRVCPARSGR